jgi:hypothetical protein
VSLILTINSPHTIWMLADRRLSYSGRPPKDDARKLMFLEALDGQAILGYAGLGATRRGTEPADWMSAVLRGRNLPLERSLGVIAEAMKREFPRHMVHFPPRVPAGHDLVIPSFVNDEVRLYSIGLAFDHQRRNYSFRYTRHSANPKPNRPHVPPRIGVAGSGLSCLAQDKRWMRKLLRLVRAHDAKRVGALVVADQLAEINQFAHRNTPDGTVGPKCIVAWRYNKLGIHKGGGAHQFYDEGKRARDSGAIPAIANGMDMQAFVQAITPHIIPQMSALIRGGKADDIDTASINADLAKLPQRPDEELK